MSTCPACGGDGECHNDFHSELSGLDPMAWAELITGTDCPACGGSPMGPPGKCSVCGGSGEIDDD